MRLPSLAELSDDALDMPSHLSARTFSVVGGQRSKYALVICDRRLA